ncbi:MAG: tyrosine-type recombinase/integrase [Candidatus Thiodiazotropha endolucinida]|nr:tyrosine-type recombinase/integrase [Candidatus Thiodiazotropha endolucinida]
MHRGDTECSVVHEANSAPFVAFLETSYQRSPSQNTSEQTLNEPSDLVAEPRQFADREIILSNTQHKSCDNRCIKKGLRGSFREPNLPRFLVRNRKKITHKSPRAESSAFDHSEILAPFKRPQCTSAIGQYNSGSVYKQTRGNKVSSVMFSDMGFDADDNQEQNNAESSPYNWESEHPGRRFEQSPNTSYRMDTERFGNSEYISDLGYSHDRSVCLGGESQSDNVLFLDSQSTSIGHRRPVSVLGMHGGICVSSNSIDTQSPTTHEEVSLSVDPDSPTVAQETLVYRPSSNVSSMPEATTSDTRPSVSTTDKNNTPKSSNLQACGMAALNRSFKNKGFSTDTRKLMEASWRPGTQKDYAAKFNKFSGWCIEREINPYTATVTQCAEFLSFLFHSGLKYRTIAGYRSMLSVVLPPADGMPVGQHPDILRLLKGVFNSRPPEKRLLPEWDLKKVLDFLSGSLFEPISKVSLKYVTLKSVFLAAISTFRRCSDLQALRIDEGFMSIVPEGIIFIRDGLSKQDRPGHVGTKIFIPTFQKNVKLDPKRAIQMYLKKTEQVRNDENKLFLSFNKPHKAVSSQTISSWIVSVLKQAYNDSDLKVKAHSTRAIGSSWALFKGASLSSILETADWSRDSTFKKFYYRQLNSQEWELE